MLGPEFTEGKVPTDASGSFRGKNTGAQPEIGNIVPTSSVGGRDTSPQLVFTSSHSAGTTEKVHTYAMASTNDEVSARVDPPERSSAENIITFEPVLSEGETPDTAHTSELVVTRRDELKGKGSALKYRTTGQIGSEVVSYVERFDHEGISNNWIKYRDAGLPVVPTMSKTDYNTVLMTDLTADGSELYGNSILRQLKDTGDERQGTVFEPAPGVDERFLELTHPDNIGEIETEIDRIIALADEKGIRIPDDPMELLVSPTGEWRMIIVDLEATEYNNQTGSNDTVKESVLNALRHGRKLIQKAQQRKTSS